MAQSGTPLAIFSLKPFWVPSCPVIVTSRKQSYPRSVPNILAAGHIFQVLRSIVFLVAVLMINLETLWTNTQECLCYQSVNGSVVLNVRPFQRHSRITILINFLVKNSVEIGTLSSFWVDVTNRAKTTDFVSVLKTNYRSPFFNCVNIFLSQDVNLRNRFTNWQGSPSCLNSYASRPHFNIGGVFWQGA